MSGDREQSADVSVFICDICKKSFRWESHLQRHRMIHTNERPHKCEKCGRAFVTKGNLTAHMRTHQNVAGRVSDLQITKVSGGTVCSLTPEGSKKEKLFKYEVATTPSSLVTWHVQVLTEKDVHKCKLQPRLSRRVNPYQYTCQICSEMFKDAPSFFEHRSSHPPSKPHKCKLCGKAFAEAMELTDHVGLHTNAEFSRCRMCNEFISDPKELNKHIAEHRSSSFRVKQQSETGKDRFECLICGVTVPEDHTSTHFLQVHMKRPMLRCGKCGKAFPGQSTLRPCPHCTFGTDDTAPVDAPMLKCDVCNRKFATKGALSSHQRTHTNEKRHKYGYCKEAFRLTETRDIHEQVHISATKKPDPPDAGPSEG